jgi:hypothetical protein
MIPYANVPKVGTADYVPEAYYHHGEGSTRLGSSM